MNKQMSDDFLWFCFFGVTKSEAKKNRNDALKSCIRRAYLDLCRTIQFRYNTQDIEKGIRAENKEMLSYQTKKETLISSIIKIVQSAITKDLLCGKALSEEEFDKWHCDLCKLITNLDSRNIVLKEGKILHYGQAQKLVNMSIKYMLTMGLWDEQLKANYKLYHMPLDSFIFSAVEDKLRIPMCKKEWSRINEKEYKDYQRSIRDKLKSVPIAPIK